MIKAVIFDCFGVLTSDGWRPFKEKYFSDSPSNNAQATLLNKQVDAGLADYDEFLTETAALAGISPADARAEIENNVANEQLFSYIAAELKPHYKIGLLSNAGANWLGELFASHQAGLFDAVSLSCDTGFVKPDIRAYEQVASQLGVQPEECVLVDDQERYCTSARDSGMQAIVYKDFEQFRRELEALLPSGSTT